MLLAFQEYNKLIILRGKAAKPGFAKQPQTRRCAKLIPNISWFNISKTH